MISPVPHPFLICLGKIEIPQHLSENEAHFQIGQIAPDAVPRADREGVVDRFVVVSIGIGGKGRRRAKPSLRRKAFWRVVSMRGAEGGPIGEMDDCLFVYIEIRIEAASKRLGRTKTHTPRNPVSAYNCPASGNDTGGSRGHRRTHPEALLNNRTQIWHFRS